MNVLMAQAFDEVTSIYHHRKGKEFLYRFRGTHKFGDKDIVPLQGEVDNGHGSVGEVTMCASVAPVRAQQPLRSEPVPLIEPKASSLDQLRQMPRGNRCYRPEAVPCQTGRGRERRCLPLPRHRGRPHLADTQKGNPPRPSRPSQCTYPAP